MLGIRAMGVPQDRLHLLNLEVAVKSPETHRSVSGPALRAWLASHGKSPKEQALKSRLREMMGS